MSRKLLIALGAPKLAQYLQGGGHWSFFLQYMFGLRELGHDVLCIEHVRSCGDPAKDRENATAFLQRMSAYGWADRCAVVASPPDAKSLDGSTVSGMSWSQLDALIDRTDVLWDVACKLRPQLIKKFRHRALVDIDPGITHLSLFNSELISRYHRYMTVGLGINDANNPIPKHGVEWKTFPCVVYLPMWERMPDPGPLTPFSSLTHWTWEQLKRPGGLVSASKRDAYLKHIALPKRTGMPFELAANIHPEDKTGDRQLLESHGWRVVDPYEVAPTPEKFREYIHQSRAEICCPKPVYVELKTGWISDRSGAYLATGRPVLMGDTGISRHLPAGAGLLIFDDTDGAVAGVEQIASNYAYHAQAAREIAREYLDSSRVLKSMLAHCGF
jgi:hypothetical protein